MALAALLIAIAAGLGTRSAHAIGWLPVGPYGGASVFAPDPTGPSRAYAAVGHVLYRTGDAGAHWGIVRRFDPSSPITSIAPAFNRPGPLYVTTGRQAWKSVDGGTTFSLITPPGVDDELRIVASSARLGHVFAYQRLGVFRSVDFGETWETTSRNDPVTFFGHRITPHPTIPDLLFLVNPTFVARSVDAGRTWATVLDVATGSFPQIRIYHMEPDRVVVNLFAHGLAVSDDSGFTFRRLAPPEPFSGFAIGSFDPGRWLGISSADAPQGAAGSKATAWESLNDGATWRVRGSIASAGREAFGFVAQSGTADGFYVFNGGNIMRTNDAGLTFVAANTGLRDVADVPVEAGSALFAGTPHGVRRSVDVGNHWTALGGIVPAATTVNGGSYSLGDAPSVIVAASALDSQRLLALDWRQSVIALSRDAGATWAAANGVQRNSFTYPGWIAPHPQDAAAFDVVMVVQAGGFFSSTGPRLVTSTDFGATTMTLPPPDPGCPPQQGVQYTLERSRAVPHRMLVGRACGIAHTDDNGATWRTAQTGAVFALAEDPAATGRWLAGTADGIVVSVDNGSVWQPLAFPGHAVRSIAIDPALSAHVVAAVDDGVWHSLDAGATWLRLDEGMPQVRVERIGFAAGVLFASTNEGLYRCATRICSAGSPVRTSTIVEYRNAILDHYFIAEEGDETASIDAGAAGPGWSRTGERFGGFSFSGALPDDAGSVCRFYGTPGVGPNSHFHTIFPEECDAVARDNGWTLESRAILISGLPSTTCTASGCVSSCIAGRTPVRRLYNNRAAFNDSNHRYTTDRAVYAAMQASGWVGEGIVFCSP